MENVTINISVLLVLVGGIMILAAVALFVMARLQRVAREWRQEGLETCRRLSASRELCRQLTTKSVRLEQALALERKKFIEALEQRKM